MAEETDSHLDDKYGGEKSLQTGRDKSRHGNPLSQV
jgi:hypothetical protein